MMSHRCYTSSVQRIGIRDLRNDTSRVVKRARGGERIIVTIDGVPADELGPILARSEKPSLEELIASGAARAPLTRTPPPPPHPRDAGPGPTTTEIIAADRTEA